MPIKRIITALILVSIYVPLMLFVPAKYIIIFYGAVVIIASIEWFRLCKFNSLLSNLFFITIILISAFSMSILSDAHDKFYLLFFISFLWLCLSVFLTLIKKIEVFHQKNYFFMLMGVIIMSFFYFATLELLNMTEEDRVFFIYVMAIVWFADSGAYIGGKLLGSHKMSPVISPNKTIEGAISAMLFVLLYATVASFFIKSDNQINFIIVSMISAFVSIYGDLLASLIKRKSRADDTGSIFPGHGGMLDRLDSTIASVVIFMFLYQWIL